MAVVSLVFPIYLAHVSSLAHAGVAFSFVVVVLTWFYLMALALLLGAVTNTARGYGDDQAERNRSIRQSGRRTGGSPASAG